MQAKIYPPVARATATSAVTILVSAPGEPQRSYEAHIHLSYR